MNRPVFRCALVVAIWGTSLQFVYADASSQTDGNSADESAPPAHRVTYADRLDEAGRVLPDAHPTTSGSAAVTTERLAPHADTNPELIGNPDSAPGAPRGILTGACCFGEPNCVISSEAACVAEGLRWLGPDTTCDACPQLPHCPGDSLFAQSPGNPFEFDGAGVSEAAANLQRFEKFYDIVGPITRVTFWGFDLGISPNGQFFECVESDNTFQVSLHPDVGNRPAAATCSYTLQATRTPTGIYYINGFELNEYEVALPTPCILTRGWISIVGQGDATCNFVWTSPPGPVADDFSICVGCTEVVQGIDLAVCLRGTFAGVFGACCDAADGTCTDNVEIFQCIGPTQRFTPDTLCADLSPACGVVTGACCGGEITRAINCEDGVTEADCQNPDFRFEPDSVCQFLEPACGEVEGPCCIGSISCVVTTQAVCNDEGWTWLGPDATCADCPSHPPCPPNTLFAQPPLDIGLGPSLYTSENSRQATVYDDFVGVAGLITDVQFYGVDLQPVGPLTFIECEEPIPDFEITFYEDQGNAPGAVVSTQFIPAIRTPTGIVYRGAEYNLYQAELITPVAMTRGWISIVGFGSPTCYFLWAPAADTSGGSVRELPEYRRPFRQDGNFAFCLIGDVGGAIGACCNQANGACANNVAIENCVGPNDRFAVDNTCLAAIADCGIPKGACCLGELACQFVTNTDCSSLGGEFLGVDSACIDCSCRVFCHPDAIAEGEAICSPAFQDVTNYGCDGPSPIFTTLVPQEIYCGTTGVAFDGETIIADSDWYQVVLTEPTDVSYRFETESPATIRVLDGTDGCPGFVFDGGSIAPCTPLDLFLFIGPGTYWIQIEPIGPSDASACGGAYQLTPLNAPCEGDFDFDRDVDMVDFALFQPQFGLTGGGLFGDLNGDDVIDITDVHLFETELGGVCP
ncbi:MAG: hypothetical protein H6818_19660 [Phycisphaerales bacterium]|nr:hypothetical protein [Phycisphaerales bacterium]MCB9863684.1 hypothetical protein [Phycisphaerales bacterium]